MDNTTLTNLSPNQPPPVDQQVCVCNKSIDDEDQHILTCKKCSRRFHFICTQLPAYQLQVYMKYKSIKYVCQICVPASQEIKDLLPVTICSVTKADRLEKELQDRDAQMKRILENYKVLENTNREQSKELVSLKEKLQNDPGYHTVEFVEEKMEKKLEEIKDCIIEKIERNCIIAEKHIDEKIKSYATVAASSESRKKSTR